MLIKVSKSSVNHFKIVDNVKSFKNGSTRKQEIWSRLLIGRMNGESSDDWSSVSGIIFLIDWPNKGDQTTDSPLVGNKLVTGR